MVMSRVPSSGQVARVAGHIANIDSSNLRYVNDVGSDGWLMTLSEVDRTPLYLAKYTAVRVFAAEGERTTFVAVDGAHAGKRMSLKTSNASRYLGTKAPVRSPAQMVVTYGEYVLNWYSAARDEKLNQQMATLAIEGISVRLTMNSVWDSVRYPLPAGEYDVLVPDRPHTPGYTNFYHNTYKNLACEQVWFPIDYKNEGRFLHVGNLSEGCVTVIDMNQWPAIHETIISHRSLDGLSVARLVVKGKPGRFR